MGDRFDIIREARIAILIEHAISPAHASQMSRAFGGTGEMPSMSPNQEAAFHDLQEAIESFRRFMRRSK